MRRMLAVISGLALISPFLVAALEFKDVSFSYNDAPFSREEAAAISILTNLGAVSGNPDGTFRPRRTLNRAEFLKIVLSSHPRIAASGSDAFTCFPDVPMDVWFSRYVCLAKERGMVRGYPDGLFHPERSVLFVEAVKILAELFASGDPWDMRCVEENAYEGCTAWEKIPYPEDTPWYVPSLNWSVAQNLVHITAEPGDALTRGEAARLTAAFRAWLDGELTEYLAMERGDVEFFPRSSSSSSQKTSASKSSVVSSEIASTSSSVSSSNVRRPDFPARSRFLVLGTRTEPIASAAFFSAREPATIRRVTVMTEDAYDSLDALYLIDSAGVQIGRLSLDVNDQTDKTWKGEFGPENAYLLEKDVQYTLGIEARIKERNGGGVSEEIVEVDNFFLTVNGVWSQSTFESQPPNFPFPKHQTAQARITAVANTLGATGALPVGSDQLLAEFSFTGEHVTGAKLAMEELVFDLSKSSSVTVSGFTLGANDTSTTSTCSLSSTTVSCSSIPADLGTIDDGETRRLRLFGDVSLAANAQSPFLEVSLNQPGAIGTNGAVRWTDGSGHFVWVELEAPVARGIRWE